MAYSSNTHAEYTLDIAKRHWNLRNKLFDQLLCLTVLTTRRLNIYIKIAESVIVKGTFNESKESHTLT